MLSDKLPDAANLAVGALFSGHARQKEVFVTGIYIMLGTMVLLIDDVARSSNGAPIPKVGTQGRLARHVTEDPPTDSI